MLILGAWSGVTENVQLATWMPLLCTLTVPERVTSSFSSMTSAGLAGAGASMRRRAPFSPGTSSARSRMPAPLARTISTLLSGTSMAARQPLLLGARAGKPAIREHERRLAGVGRRRDPGIEPCLGALGERAQPEGRPKPVGGAVANDDGEHEDAEQEQGAQGERIVAVGARRRHADPQAPQHLGKALAMHAPQGGRAGVRGAERQGVLIGGSRAVADAGDAFNPADRLPRGWASAR